MIRRPPRSTLFPYTTLFRSQAVREALDAAYQRHGHVEVLFSNAGTSGAVRPIVDYPADVFARTLAVHVGGAFHVLKHGLPRLSDGGSVIITSSVVGLMGFENISAYIAAKHGQVGLMRAEIGRAHV